MIDDAERILSHAQREIWLLTAACGDRRGGLVATFVNPVSIVREMPRLLVNLSVRHNTTDLARRSSAFALHLLTEREIEWVWHFGLSSGRGRDKLRDFAVRTGSTGSPVLTAAAASLDCRIEASMETGDRTAFLAAVVGATATSNLQPLTMARLRELAPADQLARMDELYARDAAIDARLIEEFRK